MTTRFLLACAAVAALAAVMPGVGAQKMPNGNSFALTLDEALPLTCEQAWVAGGKRYGPMTAIVKTLAKVSLANRHLTLPNTKEAGLEAGKGIADDCKADPDALLFAVVDKHVRQVAARCPLSAECHPGRTHLLSAVPDGPNPAIRPLLGRSWGSPWPRLPRCESDAHPRKALVSNRWFTAKCGTYSLIASASGRIILAGIRAAGSKRNAAPLTR
jgi:hypothetical protein